ncbi:MAG TPA: sulfatase-like hydrolase/transferase [Methylophilus sp.]
MRHSNRLRHALRALLRFATYLAAFIILALAIWVPSKFGEPSLEQLLYHAQFGTQGLLDTDAVIIQSFVMWCLALPFAASCLLVFIEYSIALFLVYGSSHWITRPARRGNIHVLKVFFWFIGHRAPLYAMIGACLYFGFQFSVSVFVYQLLGKDYFGEHYLNPALVKVEPIQPKNLVLIYIESLEDTYKHNAIFGKNLLTSLDRMRGTSFARYQSAPGSWWTIAGITATQCGLPLKSITMYDGNDQGLVLKHFLPNATCLGDMLHDAGYYNVYMGGDALAFAGKGMFFQNHHYDEVLGRDELVPLLNKPDLNYWGLYDDDLFKLAKAKLTTLYAAKQPFNLTLTTIDTHGPDGHFSRYCKAKGAKTFEDIVACTSDQVVEFVQYMQKNGYMKNTQVVLMGDHIAMENPVFGKLHQAQERLIFNKFISKTPAKANRDAVLPFDMLPTILDFIGFKVVGSKLGLGVSAFSKDDVSALLLDKADLDENLLNKSALYLDLWNPKVVLWNQKAPTQ